MVEPERLRLAEHRRVGASATAVGMEMKAAVGVGQLVRGDEHRAETRREVLALRGAKPDRHLGDPVLEEKQKQLWDLMRDEAMAADKELVNV